MGEVPSPVGLHEPGVLEYAQVLRHGPRGDAEQVRQGADAECPLREELDNLHALLHGQRPEYAGRGQGILSVHVS